MKIKNLVDKVTIFLFKRLSELTGLALFCFSVLLLTSLISYSPEDPNFIFPENAEIKNLLGMKGSYTSDILYQSIGLISLLVPISFFFISLSVIVEKKILHVVESLFFIILYSLTGTLFFTVFHTETYWLLINGNNGFIGNLFEETFIVNLINLNNQISYFILIILILLFFLLSINFKFKYFKFIFKIFTNNRKMPSKNIIESYDENVINEDNYISNEKLHRYHKENSIFIYLTRMDSQSVTLSEALSSGLVSISSNNTAIPEFINNNHNGFLINDFEDFIDCIKLLNKNTKLLKKISNNSIKKSKFLQPESIYNEERKFLKL